MKSVRLTVSIRERILNNLYLKLIDPEMGENKRELNEVGDKIYQEVFGPHLEHMKALPPSFFSMNDSFWVHYTKGGVVKSGFVRMRKVRLVAKSEIRETSPELDKLVAEYNRVKNKDVATLERWENIRSRSAAVLKQATTIKKLIEIWPEIQDCIPGDVFEETANLPAVQLDDINAALAKAV